MNNNNIFVYGPFFNRKEQIKIAIGTGADEDFFMKYVLLQNDEFKEASGCQFRDLGITSMKDFYVDGHVAKDVKGEFRVGSQMYKRCKSLYLLKKNLGSDSDEIVGLFSGNNFVETNFSMIRYLSVNYPKIIPGKVALQCLGTKVDFGGLIALFSNKK